VLVQFESGSEHGGALAGFGDRHGRGEFAEAVMISAGLLGEFSFDLLEVVLNT
jgi:hypothetical protein